MYLKLTQFNQSLGFLNMTDFSVKNTSVVKNLLFKSGMKTQRIFHRFKKLKLRTCHNYHTFYFNVVSNTQKL